MKWKAINITEEVFYELMKIRGKTIAKTGRNFSLNDVIKLLLVNQKKAKP